MRELKIYRTTKANGLTYFVISYYTNGKRKIKFAPVHLGSVSEVRHWFESTYQQDTDQIITIGSLADKWLLFRANDENIVQFKGHLNNWILKHPISNYDINKLEPKICRDFIRSITLAPYTVRNVVATLRTMIDDARGEQWIDFRMANPFRDRMILKVMNNGKPVERRVGEDNTIHLTIDQIRTLLGSVQDVQRRAFYTVAIYTGLRASELFALTWSAVAGDCVDVSQQLRRKGGTTKEPKKRSFRQIPMHPAVRALLDAWRMHWAERTGRAPTEIDPIFAGTKGQMVRRKVAAMLRANLRAAGLPDTYLGEPIDFHSLRRSFATLLDLAGVRELMIGALLGHKKKGVTAKHYLAHNLEAARAAILALPSL